jgi:DivIVA domain-containing protein
MLGPMLIEQPDPIGRAMSAYQPDAEAVRHNPEAPSSFRMVRRGYDRDEVDACFSQLAARLRETLDQTLG